MSSPPLVLAEEAEVTLPVRSADSGKTHDISIPLGEEVASYIRRQLEAAAAVPAEDQILLVGPPYKPLDALFQRAPLPAGAFIYVYDRRRLKGPAPRPPAPMEPYVPAFVPQEAAPCPAALAALAATAEANPLLKAIEDLERQFMLSLNVGQAHGAESSRLQQESWQALNRARVQEAALATAVSNLVDHAEMLRRQFDGLSAGVAQQSQRHQALLEGFESDLAQLGRIPLHSTLAVGGTTGGSSGGGSCSPVAAPASSSAAGAVAEVGSSAAGAVAEVAAASSATPTESGTGSAAAATQKQQQQQQQRTLLNCVQLDQLRRDHASCAEAHRRFLAHMDELRQQFESVQEGVHAAVESAGTMGAEIAAAEEEARRGDAIRDAQLQRLRQLEQNYDVALEAALLQFQGPSTAEPVTTDPDLGAPGSSSTSAGGGGGSGGGGDGGGGDLKHSMQLGVVIQSLHQRFVEQQQGIAPAMEAAVSALACVAESSSAAQAAAGYRLNSQLRGVAALQRRIQQLQEQLRFVERARQHKDVMFAQHIEVAQRIPGSYQAFLHEIVRRRTYRRVVEARVGEAVEFIAALRSGEIVARERFRVDHLSNLPAATFHFPALLQPPPHFNPPFVAAIGEDDLPIILPRDTGVADEDVLADVLRGGQAVAAGCGGSVANPSRAGNPAGAAEDHVGSFSPGVSREVRGSVILQPDEAGEGTFGAKDAAAAQAVSRVAELEYENAMLRARLLTVRQQLRPAAARPTRTAAAQTEVQAAMAAAQTMTAPATADAAAAAGTEMAERETQTEAAETDSTAAAATAEQAAAAVAVPAAVAAAGAAAGETRTAKKASDAAEAAAAKEAVDATDAATEAAEAAAAAVAQKAFDTADAAAALEAVAAADDAAAARGAAEDATAAQAAAAAQIAAEADAVRTSLTALRSGLRSIEQMIATRSSSPPRHSPASASSDQVDARAAVQSFSLPPLSQSRLSAGRRAAAQLASAPAAQRALATSAGSGGGGGGAESKSGAAGAAQLAAGGDVAADVEDVVALIASAFQHAQDELKGLKMELELQREEKELRSMRSQADRAMRISYRSFGVGDTALFMPIAKDSDVYLAFHHNCPQRFLARDAVETIRRRTGSLPEYILGKIILIDTCNAGDESDDSTNPYALPEGVVFHVLYVETVLPAVPPGV